MLGTENLPFIFPRAVTWSVLLLPVQRSLVGWLCLFVVDELQKLLQAHLWGDGRQNAGCDHGLVVASTGNMSWEVCEQPFGGFCRAASRSDNALCTAPLLLWAPAPFPAPNCPRTIESLFSILGGARKKRTLQVGEALTFSGGRNHWRCRSLWH